MQERGREEIETAAEEQLMKASEISRRSGWHHVPSGKRNAVMPHNCCAAGAQRGGS